MKIWSLKGKKVLIVDDFHEMRSLSRSMLTPFSPNVIKVAKDGAEAISLLENIKFDIVLCDYNLGSGKDGQQILEEARHRSLLPHSAVYIMITAENTSRMVMGAIDFLPDDYISKPFTKNQLQARLQKQMERKESLLHISRAISEKDYHTAISLCDAQLSSKPKNRMELYKTKTDLLIKLGKYENAGEICEKLLEERDIPWASMILGQARYYEERCEEAEEVFESLIRDNPANAAAHDWLAQVLEKLDDNDRAQEVIIAAIEISPKSILRQRKLGEIAYRNEDYAHSEKAFKHAAEIGKHSCYKKPDDYSHIAKCMLKRDAGKDALNIVSKLKSEFGENNPESNFHAALTESLIYKEMGDMEKSTAAVETAMGAFGKISDQIAPEIAMDLADTCLALGKKDEADELIKQLVRNHHDNQAVLDRTRDIYEKAGFADEGNELIKDTCDEVIKVNNQGAKLLKDGKLEESIELFIEAAKGMPENAIINLNAAYSMIMQMQKTGMVNKYARRATKYLDKVHALEPSNKKYFQLMEMIQNLSSKAA